MPISRRSFIQWAAGLGLTTVPNSPAENPFPNRERSAAAENLQTSEAWIEIDLERLRHNLHRVRNLAKVPVLAVIKANAYGHGLVEIGGFLDQAGAAGLMVCRMSEAVELREAGVACPVYNFGPLLPEHMEMLIRHRITPMISAWGHKELDRAARHRGVVVEVNLHIDTGMHRMGVPIGDAMRILRELDSFPALEVSGISTTLTEDEASDRCQLQRLLDLDRRAEEKGMDLGIRHAASSAALFTSPEFYLDMVRPGIVLYGYYPNAASRAANSLDLSPVLSFKTRVAEVKTVLPGEGISYHHAYRASERETIAVLPVGYADGYPPQAAGRGHVLIKETPCPIIASITANHMEVRLPRNITIEPGEPCVLIGRQGRHTVTADDLADWTDSASNYRILINLSPLLPRLIRSG
jgi:alanine racemase